MLLLNLIGPALNRWCGNGLVTNHFFIRYWDEGQHIRLRIKTGQLEIEEAIGDLTQIYESNFRSSSYDENFKIQVTDHVQELERYGGTHSIAVAEHAFEYSSTIVLNLLAQYEQCWNYSVAISMALQAHLLFIKALGKTLEDAIPFLEFLSDNYIIYSVPGNEMHYTASEVSRIKGCFQRSYDQQKDSIDYLCKKIWEGNNWDNRNWRSQWSRNMKKVIGEFNSIAYNGLLEKPTWLDEFQISQLSTSLLSQWTVWSSFFHMTNNRLGIYLRDEAYLYYCLQRGLLTLVT